jgi:hypothetical protein
VKRLPDGPFRSQREKLEGGLSVGLQRSRRRHGQSVGAIPDGRNLRSACRMMAVFSGRRRLGRLTRPQTTQPDARTGGDASKHEDREESAHEQVEYISTTEIVSSVRSSGLLMSRLTAALLSHRSGLDRSELIEKSVSTCGGHSFRRSHRRAHGLVDERSRFASGKIVHSSNWYPTPSRADSYVT